MNAPATVSAEILSLLKFMAMRLAVNHKQDLYPSDLSHEERELWGTSHPNGGEFWLSQVVTTLEAGGESFSPFVREKLMEPGVFYERNLSDIFGPSPRLNQGNGSGNTDAVDEVVDFLPGDKAPVDEVGIEEPVLIPLPEGGDDASAQIPHQ